MVGAGVLTVTGIIIAINNKKSNTSGNDDNDTNKKKNKDIFNEINNSIKTINENINQSKNKEQIKEYIIFINNIIKSIKENNYSEELINQLNKNFDIELNVHDNKLKAIRKIYPIPNENNISICQNVCFITTIMQDLLIEFINTKYSNGKYIFTYNL